MTRTATMIRLWQLLDSKVARLTARSEFINGISQYETLDHPEYPDNASCSFVALSNDLISASRFKA
jgi:hypothetical protein